MKGPLLARHLVATLVAGLCLAMVQVVFQAGALSWVYWGQILPPYEFFPTELYTSSTKVWRAVGSSIGLAMVPDHFLAPSLAATLRPLPLLLMRDAVTVAACLPAVLAAGALWGPRVPSVRGYLLRWTIIATAIHVTSWLHTVWSMQGCGSLANCLVTLAASFVLCGTVVALGVLITSCAASLLLVSFWEQATMRGRRIMVVSGLGALFAASAWPLAVAGGANQRSIPPSFAAPAPPARVLPQQGRGPWNVLLISIDSLRADHLGCYGYPRATSPAIDQLAADGTLFRSAYSPTSWTLPAHVSLFTSRYQLTHGVSDDSRRIPPNLPTLAEVLRAADYATAGFVSGPYVGAPYGFDRGMDTYQDVVGERGSGDVTDRSAPAVNAAAIQWLETHRNDRFFLFLHYYDVHYDYDPPPPYDTLFDPEYQGPDIRRFYDVRINPDMPAAMRAHFLALYDGEIRFTDDHVAELLRTLSRLDLEQRTIVILVADHGDEFFEHGAKGHRQTLYDEVLRIPLIMRLPNHVAAGRVLTEQVSLLDVMPTVLDLLRIEAPDGMEGRSLVPALAGDTLLPRPVYGELYFPARMNVQVMMRTTQTKIIQHFRRMLHPRRPAAEWYDLAQDPAEQRNVARGAAASRMRADQAQLRDWLNLEWDNRNQRAARADAVHVDPTTHERLRALGYVD